uniref:Oligosaccharyl transferase 48 kDa subunit n=1 Tax=Panagrellus redivivus TaxID=6233 RepID=A0A7E4VK19_PANRE
MSCFVPLPRESLVHRDRRTNKFVPYHHPQDLQMQLDDEAQQWSHLPTGLPASFDKPVMPDVFVLAVYTVVLLETVFSALVASTFVKPGADNFFLHGDATDVIIAASQRPEYIGCVLFHGAQWRSYRQPCQPRRRTRQSRRPYSVVRQGARRCRIPVIDIEPPRNALNTSVVFYSTGHNGVHTVNLANQDAELVEVAARIPLFVKVLDVAEYPLSTLSLPRHRRQITIISSANATWLLRAFAKPLLPFGR